MFGMIISMWRVFNCLCDNSGPWWCRLTYNQMFLGNISTTVLFGKLTPFPSKLITKFSTSAIFKTVSLQNARADNDSNDGVHELLQVVPHCMLPGYSEEMFR